RNTYDQSFFSVVEVTKPFLPLVLASRDTIINHTNQTRILRIPGTSLRAMRKAAARQYTYNLRNGLQTFGVRVIELVSGVIGSNILNQMVETPSVLPPDSM
ncbi:uncharacterized protein BDR25DRAFT_222894, partial [Lindgomyces ingoldianus]